MRDPNTTLGGASVAALMIVRARRKAAFEGTGKYMTESREISAARARAEREAEAATWIEEVKARKRG